MTDFWHSHDDVPEPGRKAVGLFLDGSGSKLVYVHDKGAIDAEGDEVDWANEDFWTWAYLPDGFQFWCEIRRHDPLTLPKSGE